jgi:hypothetical protein
MAAVGALLAQLLVFAKDDSIGTIECFRAWIRAIRI